MNDHTPQPAPPAYERESVTPGFQWRIRNARYRSTFLSTELPKIHEFREHLEYMKDSFSETTRNIGSPARSSIESQVLAIEYSQAFNDIAHLICEYQVFLKKVQPLLEEDVLFLLLSRYAQNTGVGVYLEIRRPSDIQVYDSELPEPYYTADMQDQLVHASGVVNAQYPLRPCQMPSISEPANEEPFAEIPYMAIPQTPSTTPRGTTKSSVTVNFPAMQLVSPIVESTTDGPPSYSSHQEHRGDTSTSKPGSLPEKLHPPAFTVQRCIHPGVEGTEGVDENDAFELPVGMPEAVQHIIESPDRFYHIGFHIGNRSRQSCPIAEGAIQAFKCHIPQDDRWVFVTIERTGDMLAYNCFADQEVWAACHPNHEEYR